MAGVTNAPFRQLCRESARAGLPQPSDAIDAARRDAIAATDAPEGIFVSEMVTSRALVERTPESMRIISPAPDETLRSVQLYGVDPATVRAAVRLLVTEDRADHIDLNFGCPVPKVTKKGGGAVLPWKRDLFSQIVRGAVVEAAEGGVPLAGSVRMGIADDHLAYLEAGLMAQGAGAAWVALHARTAAEYYSGHAHWDAIARLKETVTDIPVLGNGDIWAAEDALAMVEQTGCDGVVVGRGCQGRPWLFSDLVAGFAGTDRRMRPGMADVAQAPRRPAELMIDYMEDEGRALRELRKHMAWYLKGYSVGGEARAGLGLVESLADLDAKLAALDLAQPYPGEGAEGQRGRAGTPKIPSVPQGWLDSREIDEALAAKLHEAELSVSGG